MTPAVTAVVAAYKSGDYLREAVASALAQTFPDLEVLVTDDAADDAVRELVESFGDPRVRYQANPTRLGPARNHWAGFAVARGRYLSILNHDDVWRPDFLATLVPELERNSDIVLAVCDHEVIDPKGQTLVAATEETSRRWGRTDLEPGLHRPFTKLVVCQTLPVAMGAVFRRSAIDPSDLPDIGPAYDLWLAYALARGGGGAWYCNRRLTAWRVHPTQLTGQADRSWAEGAVTCWQAMERDPVFHDHSRDIRRKLCASAVGAARLALVSGERTRAQGFARIALRSRPTSWKAWAMRGLCCLPQWVIRRALNHAH